MDPYLTVLFDSFVCACPQAALSVLSLEGDPFDSSISDGNDGNGRLSASLAAALLLQVSGPAHIPKNDSRWKDLLHGYEVWVHVQEPSILGACSSMQKHAAHSSNLACLCLHVARMLHDLDESIGKDTSREPSSGSDDFTTRMALVGKSRATAGSLNLLRVLLHGVLVSSTSSSSLSTAPTTSKEDLEAALTYTSRQPETAPIEAGSELCDALISFLTSTTSRVDILQSVPELYDATVLSMQLLLVLLSPQLYRPMVSSTERYEDLIERQQQQKTRTRGLFRLTTAPDIDSDGIESTDKENPILHHLFAATTGSNTSPHWNHHSFVSGLVGALLHRPRPPPRSTTRHHCEMTESVIRAKGDRLCADGMYETHEIVMAESPPLSEPKDGHPTIHGNSSGHRTGAGRVSVTTAQQGKRSVLFDATRGVLVLSSKLILLPFRLMTLALSLLGRGHHTKGALSQQERQRLLLQQSGQRRIRSVLWYSESPIGDL